MADLHINIGKWSFSNPVMVASGTFGYGAEMAEWVDLEQFGAIITKSVTLQERQGNRPPRIAETGSGMLNSIGLANVGVDRFISEKLPFLQQLNIPVFVNVAGSTPDEYFDIVNKLEDQSGITGYEINLSCPNVKEGGIEFGRSATACHDITGDLRKMTDRCLMIKLTPNVTFIGEIGKAVEEAGADCISAINTLIGMAINAKSRKPLLSTVSGGYSGAPIKPVALAKVYELYQSVAIPIIGIGGIMNSEDILEFMIAGATAIQLGTVNFIKPKLIESVVPELKEYLEIQKIEKISTMTGSLISG